MKPYLAAARRPVFDSNTASRVDAAYTEAALAWSYQAEGLDVERAALAAAGLLRVPSHRDRAVKALRDGESVLAVRIALEALAD